MSPSLPRTMFLYKGHFCLFTLKYPNNQGIQTHCLFGSLDSSYCGVLGKPAQVIREFQKHSPKHGLCTLSKNGAYQVETNPPMQTMQTQIITTISRSKGHNKPLLFKKNTRHLTANFPKHPLRPFYSG
jgi:hypothetical protein